MNTFKRFEMKYILSKEQVELLIVKSKDFM